MLVRLVGALVCPVAGQSIDRVRPEDRLSSIDPGRCGSGGCRPSHAAGSPRVRYRP